MIRFAVYFGGRANDLDLDMRERKRGTQMVLAWKDGATNDISRSHLT